MDKRITTLSQFSTNRPDIGEYFVTLRMIETGVFQKNKDGLIFIEDMKFYEVCICIKSFYKEKYYDLQYALSKYKYMIKYIIGKLERNEK